MNYAEMNNTNVYVKNKVISWRWTHMYSQKQQKKERIDEVKRNDTKALHDKTIRKIK